MVAMGIVLLRDINVTKTRKLACCSSYRISYYMLGARGATWYDGLGCRIVLPPQSSRQGQNHTFDLLKFVCVDECFISYACHNATSLN